MFRENLFVIKTKHMKNTLSITVLLLILLFSCKKNESIVYDWNKLPFSSNVDLQCIDMLNDDIGFVAGYPKVDSFIMKKGVVGDNPLLNYDTVIIEPDLDFIYNYLERTVPKNTELFLFKTTNGGYSWQPITTTFKSGVQDIDFLDENIGFVTTQHEGVFKTVDGGNTWVKLLGNLIYIGVSTGTSNPYNKVIFIDKNNGFVYSDKNPTVLLSTNNGGENWTYISNKFSSQSPGLIKTKIDIQAFPNLSDTVFIYINRSVYRSADFGELWEMILDSANYYNISFLSPQIGYATSSGNLMKTINGGNTWTNKSIVSSEDEFIAVNQNDFYVACLGGASRIVRLTNDGQDYYEMTVEPSVWLNDWCFPTEKCGYAVGNNGLVLKYENRD